jgi:hypothetical protein
VASDGHRHPRPLPPWAVCLGVVVTTCGAAAAQVAAPIRVLVGGEEVPSKPAAEADGDEVLVPGSLLADQLGMRVQPCATAPGMWDVQFYGNRLTVRPGNTSAQLNGAPTNLRAKPKVVGQALLVPVSALFDCFGVTYDTSRTDTETTVRITPPGARIVSIRHHVHPDKVRIAVDLEGPAAVRWQQDGERVEVRVQGPGEGPAPLLQWDPVTDPLVRAVETEPLAGHAVVKVETRGTPRCEVFTLGGPDRVVIDFLRPTTPSPSLPSRLARATRFDQRAVTTPRGPAIVNTAVVDLSVRGLAVRPAMAGETITHRARTSAIGAREGAIAGVNGGFFAPQGQPLGMLVIDGEWIAHPILGRTCLGVTTDGRILMDRLSFAGSVTAPGAGTVALDGLNCGHEQANEAIAYTSRWGPELAGHPTAVRLVVSAEGVITLIEKWQRDVKIPPDGYVISAVGAKAKALEKAQKGQTAKVEFRTQPEWPNLRHAIGGGPRLVKDGRVYITAGLERFRPDVTFGAAPRTAVGVRADGKLLLVTVDGRQPGISEGVTLQELAELMIQLGARDAMALDGGGSTTFWLRGQLRNRPSDGVERTVSNALLIVPEGIGG